MHRLATRTPAAFGVLVVSVLALTASALRFSAIDQLLVAWWSAGAAATGLLLWFPRRHRPAGFVAVGLSVGAGGLLVGADPAVATALALGTVTECVVVVLAVTGLDASRPRLHSWVDFRRWCVGMVAGAAAAAVVVAGVHDLWLGAPLWRLLLWTFLSHLSMQFTLLPLFALRADDRVTVRPREVALHLPLVALALATHLQATTSQSVTYLILPLLAWAAARFSSRWAALELYLVGAVIAWGSTVGTGAFATPRPGASPPDMAASAQTFLAIAGVTTVGFMLAMSYLRASIRRSNEQEVRLGQLMESASGTAFIATDLDGTVTWFSPGAEQLTGYRSEELVGKRDPLQLHDAREILLQASALGVVCDYGVVTHGVLAGHDVPDARDWTYVHRDGRRLTVSVNVTAVRTRNGRPQGYLTVVRDVTDRRAAEQALVHALDKERETTRRMRELDRAKNDFVSSVSHELRTPLTSIIGYTELLRSEVVEALTFSQDHLVEKIDRNSGRLLHLVEDLLTLAKVEDGQLRVEKTETDLADAVRCGVEEMTHAAHRSGVALRSRLPQRRVLLQADPHQLERLVLNLVSNAVKFTPEGGRVEVALRVEGTTAVVEVSDTGIGIPQAEQDKLFGRFFRSSTATDNAIQGTGLGLSIVRSIAEAHDGEIGFTSEVGRGTTFRFRVPLGAVTEAAVERAILPEADLDFDQVLPSAG